MFCAVCSMCNIWYSSLFKLFLFLETNTQWHLLQLLSSEQLSCMCSPQQLMISFWISSGNILPSHVTHWPLSLTWLSLAVTLCNPRIQWAHLVKGLLFQMRVFHQPQDGKVPKLPSLVPIKPTLPPQASASHPRGEGNLPKVISLLGQKDWMIFFVICLVEGIVWKFTYLGVGLLMCVRTTERFLKVSRC